MSTYGGFMSTRTPFSLSISHLTTFMLTSTSPAPTAAGTGAPAAIDAIAAAASASIPAAAPRLPPTPTPTPRLRLTCDFNPVDVPKATKLDYATVPYDPTDEGWGFNQLFYSFKCRNPVDPQQALYIKMNEISLLKKKALLGNTYMIFVLENPEDVTRGSVCQALYMTKELTFIANYRTTTRRPDPIQFDAYWCVPNMPYSRKKPNKQTRLWENVVLDKGLSCACRYTLFFMGVKYGSLCTKALYDEIVRLYASKEKCTKLRLKKIEHAKAEAQKGKKCKHKAIVIKSFYRQQAAKIAYALDLHPEDEIVGNKVKKEFEHQVAEMRAGAR